MVAKLAGSFCRCARGVAQKEPKPQQQSLLATTVVFAHARRRQLLASALTVAVGLDAILYLSVAFLLAAASSIWTRPTPFIKSSVSMDLRSVLNTDGSSTPPRHETRPTKQGSWAAPAVPSPGERDPHPPYQRPSLSLPMAAVLSQPQPQQPPPPLLSASSYGPLRSPFESQQHSLSAGPYLQNPHVSPGVPMMPPRGESLGHSPGPSPYSQVHHPGPPSRPLASPFRPTPTMSSARTSPPPPPLVRAQSIPTTPYQQTQGYSFHQPPVREGSVVSQPSQQITIQSLAQQSPVYSPQNTRASLPPPSMPYMQASPQPVHPSASSDYTNYRQSSPWNGHDVGVSSDHRDIVSSVPQTPVSRQNSDTLRKRPVTPEKDLSPSVKRNRSSSINVSPKTRLGNAASPTERDLHSKNPAQPEKSKQDNQVTERMNSTGSDPPDSRQSEVSNKQPAGSTTATWTGYPPATPKPSHQKFSNGPKTASPVSTEQIRSKSSVSNMTDQPSETSAAADLPPPKKRRTRYEEPPIFARRAPRRYGHPPQIPLHLSRNSGMNHQEATPSASSRRETSQVPAPSPTPALEASSLFPTVTGVIPYEEVSRTICDFLFNHVVRRRDIGVGNTGGSAPGQGAVIEIEAKLGKLIDRNRGARLHLPVMTECVLDREDPGLRVSFESSMTLVSFAFAPGDLVSSRLLQKKSYFRTVLRC